MIIESFESTFSHLFNKVSYPFTYVMNCMHAWQTMLIVSYQITVFFLYLNVRFLGSVEVNGFKGNEIICDAMKEVQHYGL